MDAKWNIPDQPGFSALIESIKNAKRTSDAAASDVSGLQSDIQGLASQTTSTFGQVNTALNTMDGKKQDKTKAVPFTIPTQGWQTANDELEEFSGFPIYYDLPVAGVTAKDRATISLAPSAGEAARACGICTTSETLAGKIRIRAATLPTQSMAAEYWIHTGKE